MAEIKAIETVYRGYRMRSRLEARWAVYFDALKLPWEYEREGYDLGDGILYLPDFWLPLVNMWAEVKPEAFSNGEKEKCRRLAVHTGHPCLMLVGVPDCVPYWAMECDTDTNDPAECDYILSNYHGYPQDEHRFYGSTGMSEGERLEECWGVAKAVEAARSARFEHGQNGVTQDKHQKIDRNSPVWQARVAGWAKKKYGPNYWHWPGTLFCEQELLRFLREKGEV